jgi:transcription factor SFP1
MEKEKPFKCDVCGKRYKNLNGLKYVSLSSSYLGFWGWVLTDWSMKHKQHSPMCDPDLRAQHQTLLSSMMQNPATFLALQQNLPNITEDTMH